jgi:HTH-type transcriptional regulator, sugar sensing transcriptional regulator
MIQHLQELGLSNQQSKIYLALVKLGKSSASKIATEAKVSYGTIYDVLSQMERQGLVKTVPEKTKKFIPTSPEHLLDLIKQKENSLNKLKKGVKEMKELYEQEPGQPVVIAQGKSNFYKLKSEVTSRKKRDYSIRPIFEYHPASFRRMKSRIKKGVDYKIISGPNSKKEVRDKYKKQGIKIHKTPIDNVIMAVYDKETLITLINKNTTILIKDKNFTDLMAWFFTSLS